MKSIARLGSVLLLLTAVTGVTGACQDDVSVGADEDGGTTSPDSGTKSKDGGVTTTGDAAATCVTVDPASFSKACKQQSDCILIPTGKICDGSCQCGGTPLNKSGEAAYEQATSGLTFGECACPAELAPDCVNDVCVAGAVTVIDAGPADGGSCVNVDFTQFPDACNQASDCALIQTGKICDGDCGCASVPTNQSGLSTYEQATKGITFGECACPAEIAPACVNHRCVSGDLAVDAGPADAAPPSDSGSGDGGAACVDINLASYSLSCDQASDCTVIQTGEVCDGNCNCGGSAINVSGESQYEQAIKGITFGECACPDSPPPSCVNHQCTTAFTSVDAGPSDAGSPADAAPTP